MSSESSRSFRTGFATGAAQSGRVPSDARPPLAELDLAIESLCDRLDELDDVVFAALKGCRISMQKARRLWPETVREVGGQLVAESREQYLERALEIAGAWDSGQPLSAAAGDRIEAALEVIALLSREES